MTCHQLRRASVLCTAVLILMQGAVTAQTRLGGEGIDRIAKAVVRVVALRNGEAVSSGSGTVIDPAGLITTNRHVVAGADDYLIEVLDDINELPVPRYRAGLIGYSSEVDFAVLQISHLSGGQPIVPERLDLPSVSWAEQSVRRGEPVALLGYPGIADGYLAFTEGIVTTVRNGELNDRRLPMWYQTDAEAAPGNSGGLAVNAQGEMVGIPTTVAAEERTGGRLSRILGVNAIAAALEAGLETDLSRLEGAAADPVIDTSALDYQAEPNFGSVDLEAGFRPDPHWTEVLAGGAVDVSYLGGDCVGHASSAPDVQLYWRGASDELSILFVADEEHDDTALVVNLPDGTWACNDDAADGLLDPLIVIEPPQEGRYDIWVGSYEPDPDPLIWGQLGISELDLGEGR